MPHFYMDVDDGRDASHDVDGSDYDDAAFARRRAIQLLAQTVHDADIDEDARNFRVDLRDEQRKVIFRATLLLRTLRVENS